MVPLRLTAVRPAPFCLLQPAVCIPAADAKLPEQSEDSHSDELTLNLLWDAGVVNENADPQQAAELVRDGGQVEVVAQVEAGTEQRDQSQAAAQQVVGQQHPGAALGRQELLHQRVVEATLRGVAGQRAAKSRQSRGRQAFGQSDGAVVAPIQLLHDEGEVRLQDRRCGKPPEQGGAVHQHRHQQQHVGEELERRGEEERSNLTAFLREPDMGRDEAIFLTHGISPARWPEHLFRQGKAITTIKLYLVNISGFLSYFRDTPPSTSRVPKKSMVSVLRAQSSDLRKLSRRVVLRQLQKKARRMIPRLLDTIETTSSQNNIHRFYGYFSAYLSSIYGHRTGVLTNMPLPEVGEAHTEAKSGEQGFVINVILYVRQHTLSFGTKVKEHKTNHSFGPAQAYLTVQEFGWLEQWLQVREKLQPSTNLVFFNESNQKITNLQQHLQSAWAEMGFSRQPTFTDSRNSIATYAKNVLSTGTRSKVSKTMCHDPATADMFYAMSQTAEHLAELRIKFQQATDPDAPGSADPPLLMLFESSSKEPEEPDQSDGSHPSSGQGDATTQDTQDTQESKLTTQEAQGTPLT
ncbi:hypothetical protein CCH79_00018195, partial [Gambusia affinis]